MYPFAFKQAFDGVTAHISSMEIDRDILFQPLLKAIAPSLDVQQANAILSNAPNIQHYQWPEFEDFYQPIKRETKENTLARELTSLLINHAKFYSFRADVTTNPALYRQIEVMLMDDIDAGHQYLKQRKLKDGQILKSADKRFREFQPPMTPAFSVRFVMAR